MSDSSQDVSNIDAKKIDPAILKGRQYASPSPGEEVCITGISGSFPNALNVDQFKEKLFNKIDMVCDDERRWTYFNREIPRRSGKICNIEKFDAGFFGINHRHVECMDPGQRLALEKAVECIFDAGMHPSELEGTKTGVFMGLFYGESESELFDQEIESKESPILGGLRSVTAHRISHFFKLKGPSTVIDTASSSSLHALENAYRHIRDGVCDMAIVGACNLCLHPLNILQFARLGMLSIDGTSRAFDENGHGYCKSEAIIFLLLQKAEDTRRVYAKVKHAKANCDGFKEIGINYPSREMEQLLLDEFYEECQINPADISFVEAHAPGTKAGDTEEGSAIDKVFCCKRERPLLIGSVKSNMGHSEASSGFTSLIKSLIAMEEEHIPPNIHFNTPKRGIEGLIEGRMKVVVEKTPFPDRNGLIAINNFGFGGANCHVLLEWNHKTKLNRGSPNDEIPRLVCVSGRNSEAISCFLDKIDENFDAEYIQLLHEVFKANIECHNHRGYSVVSKTGRISSSWKRYFEKRPTLLIAFGDFGCSWQKITNHLMNLPVFSQTILNVQQILNNRGLHIVDIMQNNNLSVHPVVSRILGTVVLQLGIIELMKNLKLQPNVILGHVTGEIACAYFEGLLTLEQAVLAAFEMANHLKDVNEASTTYLVKFNGKEVSLPLNVEITWRHSDDLVVISGRTEETEQFVLELQENGSQIVHLAFTDITLHSRKYVELEPNLLESLRTIIPDEKLRKKSWLSFRDEPIFSAEYLVKSLYSEINPLHLISSMCSDTLILEIGSGKFSGLLNFARCKPLPVVNFEQKNQNNGLVDFLNILGNLYEYGFNPHILNLYPKYQYPVSRGTPTISDKIRWDHSHNWHVYKYTSLIHMDYYEGKISVIPKDEEWNYITGHVVDGRALFPAAGYIDLIWKTFAAVNQISKTEVTVVFENCKFDRATHLGDRTDFLIGIKLNSGDFQINEGEMNIVTGNIHLVSGENEQLFSSLSSCCESTEVLNIESKDIYMELRLRGYQYKSAFQLMQKCNMNATKAYLKWTGNWVTFIDNMFQMCILQFRERLLYVPIGIGRIVIDAEKHLRYVESFEDNCIPVYFHKDSGMIRCGGIEMRGFRYSRISRRKLTQHPLLERYQFVPNETSLSLVESVRINIQISLENHYGFNVKVVELIDNASRKKDEPLGPLIFDAFSDQPLVQADITILSKKDLVIENVTIDKEKTLATQNECLIVIGTDIIQRTTVLNQALSALKSDGFILSRQDLDFELSTNTQLSELDIITVHSTEREKLILFRKSVTTEKPAVVRISSVDKDFSWLKHLQKAFSSSNNVIMYSSNEDNNGILGLYNCLRKEAVGTNVQCFMIYENDEPPFNINDPFYRNQIKKNMSVNIYKDRKWGTYRHLLMNNIKEMGYDHCFFSQGLRKNQPNSNMVGGPLNSTSRLPPGNVFIQTCYAAINSEYDVAASANLNVDDKKINRSQPDFVQGFSGYDRNGRRVMGLSSAPLSTLVYADSDLLFDIPEKWTMEEAATVPEVYATVLYALFEKAKIVAGESILIHSGSGGIGQAAINVALSRGCYIFTTIDTLEKRELLKELFPQLSDRQIGNSRDSTFEILVKKETKGRGVDVVLNSLTGEQLMASVRCLAKGGRFLELGKFDFVNDNRLELMLIQEECSFHGVIFDQLLISQTRIKRRIISLLNQGIKTCITKPHKANIFKIDEFPKAFHSISSEKKNDRVLIQIQTADLQIKEDRALPQRLKGLTRFHCDSYKSYVILGGLGGFGLELVDWLVMRGAKKLILCSRKSVRTRYQIYRMSVWRSQGVVVNVSTDDISTKEGCESLINEAEKLGTVDGIFNLAVVLKDSILENQTAEYFKTLFKPKVYATEFLDEITRRRCPQLRYFVIFSSYAGGRGIVGQTNYGMANSAAERICEKRTKAGYPALAIQWGLVGDVGLLVEMQKGDEEFTIEGTVQQKISSCLEVMDIFLCQKQSTIVSSMVIGEKFESANSDNIVDAVANIIGVKKNIVSPYATLAELGMDSITAVDIKQVLERKFGIFQSPQQIRSLTLTSLQAIEISRNDTNKLKIFPKYVPTRLDLFLQNNSDNSESTVDIVRLPSLVNEDSVPPIVYLFPGVNGSVKSMTYLAAQLRAQTFCFQYCYKETMEDIKTISKRSLEHIKKHRTSNESVNIVCFSWGTVIGLEVTSSLEKEGVLVNLMIIDGSVEMVQDLLRKELRATNDKEMQVSILCLLIMKYYPEESYKEVLAKCPSSEERLEVYLKAIESFEPGKLDYKRSEAIALFARIKESFSYEQSYEAITASSILFKPLHPLYQSSLPEDYNLSTLCSNFRGVTYIEGNHISILESRILAEEIEIFIIKNQRVENSSNINKPQ